MTRISPHATERALRTNINLQNKRIDQESRAVATGYKVFEPGDSKQSGTISRFREMQNRLTAHEARLGPVQAMLSFQSEIMTQTNEALLRAKEIATQAANETVSPEIRSQLAAEVWQLREQVYQLANSTYQGRYIYGGTADGTRPYSPVTPFTDPATGTHVLTRYVHSGAPGTEDTKTVPVTDDMDITITTPGNTLFDRTLETLTVLGRALEGYRTSPTDTNDTAYTFPADFTEQTNAIKDTLNRLTAAREQDIMPEQVSLAGRMRRAQIAESILDLTKTSAKEALARLQEADIFEATANLSSAQTSLEASLTITSRILGKGLLDYL